MAKDLGWIKLYRSSFDNELYFAEPFTKWQAWCDLLLLANHKPGFIKPRGIRMELKRGQTGYSVVKLAIRWRWSRTKTNRFLNELEKDNQIIQQKTNATTLISIVNYKLYQDSDTADDTTKDTASSTAELQKTIQQKDTNKNVKNDINNNNINNNAGAPPPPAPPVLPIKFKPEDFNGIPINESESVIQSIWATQNVEIDSEKVKALWEVFKYQKIEGGNYNSRGAVYRHFFNWANKQSFRKKREPKPKAAKKDEKIIGKQFINNFTQCLMSDGSIQDLTQNQTDSAAYGQINPSSIFKN